MVTCLSIASGLTSTRIGSKVHRCLAIQAQSLDAAIIAPTVFGFDVVKDRIGLGQFFWGIALTTGFNR